MSGSGGRVADATGNWVDLYAPANVRPYLRLARLDRPIGSWLLLMPCWWSTGLTGLAMDRLPSGWHIALFFIGAFAMRGAGCTWNDLVDRDLDGKVERTRSRPIPSGQVTARQAAVFMVAQSLIGLLVLLQFNPFTIATGLASLLVVAVYPFMKRITYWPQIFLGLAFSWGALMGWPAAFGRLDWAPVILYAGSICWVIAYDTIYAHQDREDDMMIGIACAMAGAGWITLVGLAGFAAHLAWQVRRIDIDDPALCLRLFRSNRDAGLILFAAMLIDAAV